MRIEEAAFGAGEMQPPELARLAVEEFVRFRRVAESPHKTRVLKQIRAASFVTLRTAGGELRGCIGTVEPAFDNLAEEIIHNAIAAASRDPRFMPVTAGELDSLTYGVDVLSPPEAISGPEELNPEIYGVIVETPDRSRRGLLLPRIEGIDTITQQWRAVHWKAGIEPGAPVRLWRFEVTRFK